MIPNSLKPGRGFYTGLFTLALPIMVQNLILSSVNMVDTLMVGRLGTVEIAAVGLGNQVFFLLSMILFGVSSGGAVFTAQYWGKKDIAGIRKTTGFCLAIALGTSTVFTAVCMIAPAFVIGLYSNDPAVIKTGAQYLRTVAPCFLPFSVGMVYTLVLRTVEKVRLAMTATIVSLLTNVTLNYVLIFGMGPIPAMGVTGAAIATVIARFIEVSILVSVSYKRRYPHAGTVSELTGFDAPFVAKFAAIAAPVILNEMLWGLGITSQNAIFAKTGTEAIAAFNVVTTVSNLVWVFYIGLANGAAILVGKKIGEGETGLARSYARGITNFSVLTAPVVALMLLALQTTLPALFNVQASVLSLMGTMFLFLALAYPFRAFNISMVIGVCRAGGDTRFCIVYDLAFMWLVALPAAAMAAFVFHAPVAVIYCCVISEEFLKVPLGYLRLRSGKWLHDVT